MAYLIPVLVTLIATWVHNRKSEYQHLTPSQFRLSLDLIFARVECACEKFMLRYPLNKLKVQQVASYSLVRAIFFDLWNVRPEKEKKLYIYICIEPRAAPSLLS